MKAVILHIAFVLFLGNAFSQNVLFMEDGSIKADTDSILISKPIILAKAGLFKPEQNLKFTPKGKFLLSCIYSDLLWRRLSISVEYQRPKGIIGFAGGLSGANNLNEGSEYDRESQYTIDLWWYKTTTYYGHLGVNIYPWGQGKIKYYCGMAGYFGGYFSIDRKAYHRFHNSSGLFGSIGIVNGAYAMISKRCFFSVSVDVGIVSSFLEGHQYTIGSIRPSLVFGLRL